MKPNLITVVTIAMGALFLGAVVAFLLYVPVLAIATVSTIALALIFMFGLGVQAGSRGIRLRLRRGSYLTNPVTSTLLRNAPQPSNSITLISSKAPPISAGSGQAL
jgi:hypothetical protein